MPAPDLTNFTWTGTTEPWKAIQEEIRHRVVIQPLDPLPRFIGGADCAFRKPTNEVRAAAVVYDRVEQRIVEQHYVVEPCRVPYVPTYLSFREIPAILHVLEKLKTKFDALLIDGQGLAHPRRCGIATHLGVLLDLPTVGCAKSRLIGTHDEPAPEAGSSVPLMDKSEQIGVVLRTKDKTNPLYVSVGHKSDLDTAIALVFACRTKYRIPEPTRVADQLSKFR
jgi:deoxyribonuclease V